MMEEFGGGARRTPDGGYAVQAAAGYEARAYAIEPDVSAACYFYAAAALTGGCATVRGVHPSSMQGDIRFLDILRRIGCTVTAGSEGIRVSGPTGGIFPGLDVDMNDCSDQALTLAALAIFAQSPTTIRGIGHIRHQESDRIKAALTELVNMGVRCEELDDGLRIFPGSPRPTLVETYDDHRMAMAFSLIGLRAAGIRIANPACVAKTFEDYWEELGRITKD